MADEIGTEDFVAAYMAVTGGTEEQAREIADLLLDPDSTHFMRALNEWASAFKATKKEQGESC